MLVLDNGTAFPPSEFKAFTGRNGICHVTTTPYHPSPNGQAKRIVQTTKKAVARIVAGNWQKRLTRFLLAQHISPNSATTKSVAEMLMGHQLTTVLDHLHPEPHNEMHTHR